MDEVSWAARLELPDHSYTISEWIELMRSRIAPKYMELVDQHYSFGILENASDPKYDHHKYWTNPLETILPNAPNTKIYCFYGIGKLTERAYYYKANEEYCDSIPAIIDGKINEASIGVRFGIKLIDGDGTVPLLSLGLMCSKAWKMATQCILFYFLK